MSGEGLYLLPAAPGTCAMCARAHEADDAHDPLSLFYHTRFKMKHGRAPTLDDAVAHLEDGTARQWMDGFLKIIAEREMEASRLADPAKAIAEPYELSRA